MNEWLNVLSEDDRKLFVATIEDLYRKGSNSDTIMLTWFQWEDDTRKFNGLPERIKVAKS